MDEQMATLTAMTTGQLLTASGLMLDLAGFAVITSAVVLSKKKALQIGVSRMAGDSDEENLRLPMVMALRENSTRSLIGGVMIVLGFALQLAGVFVK